MAQYEDFYDWELVYDCETSDNRKLVQILEKDTADGHIKSDYFVLDSVGRICVNSEESDKIGGDSDDPAVVEPSSESRSLETAAGQSDIVESECRFSGVVCTDESSEGGLFLAIEEQLDRGSFGDLLAEMASEGTDSSCEKFGGESEWNGNPGEQDITMSVTSGAASCAQNEKKNFWQRRPWDLIRFYLAERPVWSVSIAAAMVGIVILSTKLHRSKRKNQGIPLRIDDKNVSQLATSAMHLNDAMSVVRRIPIVRPFLSGGNGTQWATLPIR
ncbi:hypothetical protein HPP92_009210 [Vanilla planifolia]|uniref:DUF6821 domain-containing protein n=1 Tax=Vanilla planifolia TaxID=51239 RepID=A0A835R9K5_VANPL|nr:hypothetical protein HPP92_009210 [Vanilla planifolia]